MYWKGSFEVRTPEMHLKQHLQAAEVLTMKYNFQACLKYSWDSLCSLWLFSLIWERNNKFTVKNLLNRIHTIIQNFFKQTYIIKQSKSVFQLVKLKEKRLDQSLFSHYYLQLSKIVFRINFKVNSGM